MSAIAFHDFVEKLNRKGISVSGWNIRSRSLRVEYEILSLDMGDEGKWYPFVKSRSGTAKGRLFARQWTEVKKVVFNKVRSKRKPLKHKIVIICS